MTDYAPGYATRQQYYFDQSVGDQSWGDLTWSLVESKKLMRTDTQFGSYFMEILSDQKSYRLSFHLVVMFAFARRVLPQPTARRGKLTTITNVSLPSKSRTHA